MNIPLRLLLAAGFALAVAQSAAAAPRAGAVVEGVQMPAWVERGPAARVPLAPGMQLQAGEQVRTGAHSRVLLRMSEGSLVKLGEKGVLKIDELRPDEGGVFKAALHVLEGAFRFTTDALMKNRRRAVNITVATVTTGIRGTDLWGKSDLGDRQVVCLIEGKIEVAAPGEAPVVMDQPRQFYQRSQGKTAPVGFVDPKQLAQWALETEIDAGQGAARRSGRWKLTLASVETQEAALKVYDGLRAAGYAAKIHPVKAADKLAYEVRIASLPSKAEAAALGSQLKGMAGVTQVKVSM